MTGMSLWNNGSDIPLTEAEVTTTVEKVRTDTTTAEATAAPEWNELNTDESSQLVGLSPRVVGSATEDSIQSRPWWLAMSEVNHNEIIDNQVSSSGSAAARESAGEFGHGTMQYAEGIEPVIRDGAAFGNDYFKVTQAEIQDGAGQYMEPISDNWGKAVSQRNATSASRVASNDSMFAAFLGSK